LFFAGEPLNDSDELYQKVSYNREGMIAPLLPPGGDAEDDALLVPRDVVIPRE
jgi:hypothetical protein